VGLVSLLHPEVRGRLEVPAEVVLAELDLGRLMAAAGPPAQGRTPPRFPAAGFDLTLRVRPEERAREVHDLIEASAPRELLAGVDLVSVFEDVRALAFGRALTFRIRCRHEERTLSDEDLRQVERQVLAALAAAGAGRWLLPEQAPAGEAR
jgi:phenylalanyl-tRNA synthetase beta subunit